MLREEICAELSVRRINRVELPSDLQAAIEQEIGFPGSLAGLADKIINAFERIGKAKELSALFAPRSKVDR